MKQLFVFCMVLAIASSMSVRGEKLLISGADLAWKVENVFFLVDFSKNPRTGRSAQINTIYLKSPVDVLLTRGVDSSTFHLSPNLARGEGWVGTNRWDPPEKWSVERTDDVFSLLREGPMPRVPEIRGSCRYEIRPGKPWILVEETMEAVEDARVSLLRLDEWSVVPDERNPFTHLGWSRSSDEVVFTERSGSPRLPLQTDWVCFYSAERGFGFASVRGEFSVSGPDGEAAVPMANEGVRFDGEPHYFYRALIYPPGEIGEGNPDPLILIRKGTRYRIRYYLLFFQGTGEGAEVLSPVREFRKTLGVPVD